MKKVRVWDLPTRVFHWLLAICVVASVVSAKTGAIIWHSRIGYAILVLLLFRLVWGIIGGRWSRFTSFVYSPGSLFSYLRGKGAPEHSVGHSPLGALSVFGLLAILIAQVATGMISDDEISFTGPLVRLVSSDTALAATGYHKNVGQWMIIALVVLHVAAIVVYLLRKNNLIAPMIHGDKLVDSAVPGSRDDITTRVAAAVVLAACAGLVSWIVLSGA